MTHSIQKFLKSRREKILTRTRSTQREKNNSLPATKKVVTISYFSGSELIANLPSIVRKEEKNSMAHFTVENIRKTNDIIKKLNSAERLSAEELYKKYETTILGVTINLLPRIEDPYKKPDKLIHGTEKKL